MSKALKTVGRAIPGVGDAIVSRDAAKRNQQAYQQAGLVSARQAEIGRQDLRASLSPTLAALAAGQAEAGGYLKELAGPGMQAYQEQAALSGALGSEAQQNALARFSESPEQKYLQQQGEQAIMRQASATGGIGGSRVLEALQRQGIGMAAQDFQSRFGRLGQIASTGEQAQVNLANLAQSINASRAGAYQAQGAGLANIAVGQAAQQANMALGAGQARAAGILGVQGGINKVAGMGLAAITGNPFAAMGSMGGGNQMWNSRAASGLAGVGMGGGIGL